MRFIATEEWKSKMNSQSSISTTSSESDLGVISEGSSVSTNTKPKRSFISIADAIHKRSSALAGAIDKKLIKGPVLSAIKAKVPKPSNVATSPQARLDSILRSRGYMTQYLDLPQIAFQREPSELQIASYSEKLVSLCRGGDTEAVRKIMSCGISPNPCNEFGESLVHMVCRRGDHKMLRVMLDCGASVEVMDKYGRTPLHDACWAEKPCFKVVDMILKEAGVEIFYAADSRRKVPLSYVSKEHWPAWISWMETSMDKKWPIQEKIDDDDGYYYAESDAAFSGGSLPDPENPLTKELARMVVSGIMEPEEAERLRHVVARDDSSGEFFGSGCDADISCSSVSVVDKKQLIDILSSL